MEKFDINLNLYRSFYYVAKYGGFTKASKYALISQSSLSTNIKNLEDILGVKLFHRNKSNITLTIYGRDLYLKLEEIINILNDKSEKQEINIGALRFIADNYLSDAISIFNKKHPNIKINFNFSVTTDLYQMLKKEELDLIICRNPLFYRFENNIAVEKICDVPNVFAVSKNFYEKEKDKMLKDGYIFKMILPDSSEKRRIIEQYLIDNNFNYDVVVELPNSNLLKKLILNDVGIGYINKKSIEEELNDGSLVILDNFKHIPIDNITIIYNSKDNNPYLKFLIKLLKDTIGKSNS